MSNVLDLLDQTMFDIGQATGSTTLLQSVWVYNRPVNLDGLRQFHDHLERGLLSRCIAPSPLSFGRSRWVTSCTSSALEIVESPRPREAFDDWLDEQADYSLDCEDGPGWHLAALPFTGGGTGISLITSHCLIDGVGMGIVVADAALGRDDPTEWPTAGSRGRWRAVREDVRQTMRDIPAMGRAVTAARKMGKNSRNGAEPATPPATKPLAPSPETDESYTLPTATIFVDVDQWDARAAALGGTSNTLLVGVAALLAQRAGRVATDGSVVVTLPVNERTPGDTRANAITGVQATIHPDRATTDLREIRAAVKEALVRHQEEPDPAQILNALVPVLPKRLLRAARSMTRGNPFNLVGASNVGMIDAAAGRPDGSDADSYAMRLHHRGMSPATLQQYGGVQTLLSGRVNGRVFVSVISYLPGRSNSKDELRQDLSSAFGEFGLKGTPL